MDSRFFVGVIVGVGLTLSSIGLYQMLITKGYSIAINLLEAGWQIEELRQHQKSALVLPWIQSERELGRVS